MNDDDDEDYYKKIRNENIEFDKDFTGNTLKIMEEMGLIKNAEKENKENRQ